MFKNYLITTLRNINKHKGYSFINIIGLSIGVAVCMLILMFVQDELNYDKFNINHDRIFRPILDAAIGNTSAQTATSCAPLASALISEIPEVEAVARFRNYGFPVFRYKDKVFSEEHVFWADSSIFDVFTLPFLLGNPKNVLSAPNSLVITETAAKKYFGNENPIGKMINSDKRFDYIVTGVIKDIPKNSHFHCDFIASLAIYQDSRSPIWFSNNYYTYVLLKKGADYKEVQKKMDIVLLKFIKPQVEQAFKTTWEELIKTGAHYRFVLQPITDIHLNSHLQTEVEQNSVMSYIYIFSVIAFGILIIACFNFINLSTARYSGRAKEVGIRKTLGSTFGQLVIQFLSESIILAFISVIISMLFVYLMMPLFNDISGKQLTFDVIQNPTIIPLFLFFVFIIGVVAGIYPAFFLASFKPIKVLSGNTRDSVKGKKFRGVLVVSQFTISIILIIGTVFVFKQLDFLQNKKLGYNKEQLIIIKKTDDIGSSIEAFKTTLKNIPNVLEVSNSTHVPGMQFFNDLYESYSGGKKTSQLFSVMGSDYNFVKTFEIKMTAGRFYSKEWGADSINSIVINEAAAKQMMFKDPVGQEIFEPTGNRTPGRNFKYKIIGVMKDFNFESLHEPIKPLVVTLFNSFGFGKFTSVRIKTDNVKESVSSIKEVWTSFADGQNFEYSFFDEDYNRLYQSEERTSKLFAAFSILGIMIGCLGLFGLAAFTAEKRTKEIGIRKVLGSSIKSILLLLTKEFLKYLFIANVIAFPTAYYLIDLWLQNFAYRIELDYSVFIISGLSSIIIALVSVSYQAIKAAVANPILSLKYE
ncbi:MAG: ABC transporter permease [bacterium]